MNMHVDESTGLALKLQTEGEKLLEFFGTLSERQWSSEIYTEGTVWTTRNVLVHLVSTERAFGTLFARVREGGLGVGTDFVIDRYNASQQRKMQDLVPAELLEQYRLARVKMIEFVRSLGPDDLAMKGRHPYLGVTSLHEMIKMVYIHNQTHYRDVRRSLNSA